MMHNMKKGIGYCFMFMALVGVLGCTLDVYAVQSAVGDSENATAACEAALFDGDMLTADFTNNRIRIYAKAGKWKIKYAIDEDSSSADYSLIFGTKAKSDEPNKTYTKVNYEGGKEKFIDVGAGNSIFLIAQPMHDDKNHIIDENGEVIKASGTTCKAGKVYVNTSGKLAIENTAAYISTKFQSTSNVNVTIDETLHPKEFKECKAMQEAKLYVEDEQPYLSSQSDIDSYYNQMKVSFPYCFGSYSSSFAITAATIKTVREKSLKAYKQYLDFISAQQNNDEYDNAIKDEIEDPKLGYKFLKYGGKEANKTIINTLKCQKNQTTENTERFYTRVEEANSDLCVVTCQEQIQVTYDPPVATKAGLCFQYKVTVKSKVTCKAEKKGNITWPTPPKTCDFSPICSGNAQETQAGPIEEFDSCIQECDGGKYSQSCINKCYKKVYKNKTSKKSNNTTTKTTNQTLKSQNNNIMKLENTSTTDKYREIEGCQNNDQIKNNASECAQKFYELKQSDPKGKYVLAPEQHPSWYTHIWDPDDDVPGTKWLTPDDDAWVDSIKRSSPYYFRDYATSLKTIQSFYGENNGVNGFGERRRYIIDDGGIKRQRTTSYKCDEVCGFVSNSSDTCISNNQGIVEYYYRIYDLIETSLSQCTSKVECKEGEATFDMSVDNKAITDADRENNPSEWSSKNKTNNDAETCYNPTGDIKMFIPLGPSIDLEKNNQIYGTNCNINPNNGINGKCYGKDNTLYWQHYKTTITFPGTWINLKTGGRYYHDDIVDTSISREKPNYYCVGYNYEPVNEQWWEWKMFDDADPDKLSSVTKKIKYNIFASFNNFGKYNWGFDDDKKAINCFYALSNKNSRVCKKINKTTINKGCDTSIDNIRLRPVDQVDIFAGRTDDEIGFNWTSDAQDFVALRASNKNAKTYGINPGEYAEKLQKEAKSDPNSVYSGTTDYSFHLTRDNINELRAYVKKRKSYSNEPYTSFTGKSDPKSKADGNTYKEVSGIELYYYTSGILRDPKYISSFDIKEGILGKNND